MIYVNQKSSSRNGVVKTIPKITQTSITDTCVARSVPIFFPVSLCFLVWI